MKEFLSQKGIKYDERDVSSNAVYAQELRASGQLGVPVTVIDKQMVIGYNRQELERLLAQSQAGERPSFGASVADAAAIAAKMGTGTASGAFVGKVRPGSTAEKMGLASGDIIVELNGKGIANTADLETAFAGLGSGSRLLVVLLRDSKRMALEGVY